MMIFKDVATKDNDDAITLSVNTNGLKAHTVVKLNHNILATKDDSFNGFYIGTNKGLKYNALVVYTTVLKTPNTVQSQVDYVLEGASEAIAEPSQLPFGSSPIANHCIEFDFE